ncbi:MAG: diacylglycerol kinase family protein [Candidatus Limnocylindrales bacterium]
MGRRLLCVIHNPRAGDASPTAPSLLAMLSEAGYQTRYQTRKDAWQEALQEPMDLAVVVGGDGTVGPVAKALAGRSLPFTVLPVGTANNIAKTFGIAGDARDVVARWATTRPQLLDTWTVTAGDSTAVFVESMGAGPLVPPMRHSERQHPPTFILGGAIDRARHAFRTAVMAAPSAHWSIEADGSDLSGDYIGLEAMNIRSVGPNLLLSPAADPGDGAIDLVLFREIDREQLAAVANVLSPGRFELETHRCADVRLIPPPDVTIHVDGELWPARDRREGVELRVRQAARSRIVAPDGSPNVSAEPR